MRQWRLYFVRRCKFRDTPKSSSPKLAAKSLSGEQVAHILLKGHSPEHQVQPGQLVAAMRDRVSVNDVAPCNPHVYLSYFNIHFFKFFYLIAPFCQHSCNLRSYLSNPRWFL